MTDHYTGTDENARRLHKISESIPLDANDADVPPGVKLDRGTTLTFGEQAVDIGFNPSGDPDVLFMKRACADMIDKLREYSSNGLVNMIRDEAIRQIMTAQMWAVKAVTFKR